MNNNIENIKVGDVFSEESHYVVTSVSPIRVDFTHIESNTVVSIDTAYVRTLLKSADQYFETKKVTREDKKDGTRGIRTIFENIHSGQVFTVTFKKQDTQKSDKKFNSEINALVQKLCTELDKVKASKKGVSEWAKKTIKKLALNPISKIEEGEYRTLRGYKVQFDSRDGKYRCVDLDIKRTDKESGERFVNINTISELILDGIKYVVE